MPANMILGGLVALGLLRTGPIRFDRVRETIVVPLRPPGPERIFRTRDIPIMPPRVPQPQPQPPRFETVVVPLAPPLPSTIATFPSIVPPSLLLPPAPLPLSPAVPYVAPYVEPPRFIPGPIPISPVYPQPILVSGAVTTIPITVPESILQPPQTQPPRLDITAVPVTSTFATIKVV